MGTTSRTRANPTKTYGAPTWVVEAKRYLDTITRFEIYPKHHTNGQYKSACPFCKEGEDRFVVFVEGNYWCRKCHVRGFWKEVSPAEIAQCKERKDEVSLQRQTEIGGCTDWIGYSEEVATHLDLWEKEFILESDVKKWGLGYCPRAPLVAVDSPSLTIPVFYGERLMDIRHRLLQPLPGGRYTSHLAGLPPTFFNAGNIPTAQRVYCVEGEKKAIILMRHGITPTISYPGVLTLDHLLKYVSEHKSAGQEFCFFPDPGSEKDVLPQLQAFGKMGHSVSVVELFLKPDDLLRKFGDVALKGSIQYRRRL